MMQMLYHGTAPTRAHQDDAGLDLYVNGDWWAPPGIRVDVDLGVAIKSPPGTWTLLTGRSSAWRRGLFIAQGVIDTGYTGPLYASVFNVTTEPIRLHHGERIAQLIVFPNLTEQVELVEAEQMPETQRGARGFGSSGR